jgi:hypothetical protein
MGADARASPRPRFPLEVISERTSPVRQAERGADLRTLLGLDHIGNRFLAVRGEMATEGPGDGLRAPIVR